MFSIVKKFLSNIDRYNHPKREVDQLIDLAIKLDPWHFQGIQSSDKSILQVFVPYDTIQEYHEEINRGYICLKSGTVLRLETFADKIKSVSLPMFFLDVNGCYINEEKMMIKFNQSVLDLARFYQERLDADETNTGADRHNIRHLTPMINNLLNLYRELIRIV